MFKTLQICLKHMEGRVKGRIIAKTIYFVLYQPVLYYCHTNFVLE